MTTADPTAARKPKRRNPLVTWLIPTLLFLLMFPAGNFLGQTSFSFLISIPQSLATLFVLFTTFAMVYELNPLAETPLKAWHVIIPFYNLYWMAVLVPRQMAVAKQKAGKGPPRGAVVYLFLFLYAFAADLNDLA